MFSKNKNEPKIDTEQHELLENAQKRVKQKKRLYYHFVFFLVGSVFFIIINKVLKVKEDWDWFLWATVVWAFLVCIHVINVFVTNTFLGKDWERMQREKLVVKQKLKIEKLQRSVEKEFPLPENDME